MAWWRKRSLSPEQVAEIAARAATEAVGKALDSRRTSDTQALAGVVEGLLARQLESFGKNTDAMTNFLGAIGDLAVRRAAVALGSRGGRKRAENQEARKRAATVRTDCPVCEDARCTDQAAILRHVSESHDARRQHREPLAQAALDEHRRFVNSPANGTAGN